MGAAQYRISGINRCEICYDILVVMPSVINMLRNSVIAADTVVQFYRIDRQMGDIVKLALHGGCISLLFCTACFSQALKEKLQGDWLCTGIVNSKGEETVGEFGESKNYLRFSFVKEKIRIAQAPYDEGLFLSVNFGPTYIDLLENHLALPDFKYGVESIGPEELVLGTRDYKGEPIRYLFIKQSKVNYVNSRDSICDGGFITIANPRGSPVLYVNYKITHGGSTLPYPTFGHYQYTSFASYLSTLFKFPKTYHRSKGDFDEMVIEFDVFEKGVKNIKIVKGLTYEMNAYLFLFIENSSKNWRAPRVDGKVMPSKLRLHFIFFKDV